MCNIRLLTKARVPAGFGSRRRALSFLVVIVSSIASGVQGVSAVSQGFIENRGQVDERVLCYGGGPRATVFFTREAVVLDLHEEVSPDAEGLSGALEEPEFLRTSGRSPGSQGFALWIRFEGANPSPLIQAKGELPARYNFFLGNDPGRWRTDVRSYEEIVYRDLWPGVDLVFRNHGGELTYEFVGAGPSIKPQFLYEGAEPATGGSRVIVETPLGRIVGIPPAPDESVGRFELGGSDSCAEVGGERDNPSALLWSTFLGGSSTDEGRFVALDASGNPVVTGRTSSPDFPTTSGAYDTSYNNGDDDVFVAKLSSSGTDLLWGTFLGGSGSGTEQGIALVLDSMANPVVTGKTFSSDFPTTSGAYDESYNGEEDVFVAKLSSSGSDLLWSTFLGGSYDDFEYPELGLALDASENPVVTGGTSSSDFPTTPGAYDTSHNGSRDAFVAKLSSTGSNLLWSTFLGGSTDDAACALAVDDSGNLAVAGYAGWSGFPTTPGAYDTSHNGALDVFVAMLSGTGSILFWSTFLGGTAEDVGNALALDDSGNPVVAGYTRSTDYPTTLGAYDESHNGNYDTFLAKLSSSGSSLLWSTYLGGSSNDWLNALTLDAPGDPVVTGSTNSSDFPTTPGAYDESYNGGEDAFVARLSSSGSNLLWSSFLGGSGNDAGFALASDGSENSVVTGISSSSDFPTTPGAYDESSSGADAFVTKLASTPSGSGAPDQTVALIANPVVLTEPNPFHSTVRIRFSVAEPGDVSLVIYDVAGHRLRTLVDGRLDAGGVTWDWDGRDAEGRSVPSGVYFYRLATEAGFEATRRITLFR